MVRFSCALSAFSSLILLTTPISAQEEDRNYLMAALGDSVTAGFLASTDLTWFNKPVGNEANEFMMAVNQLGGKDKAESMFSFKGALASIFETRTTKSWSTGKEIDSHYVLLEQSIKAIEPSAKVTAVNYAISGGKTPDLFVQVDQVLNLMNSGKFTSLKYVTLLIGNNDVCTNRNPAQMKSDLLEVFRRLSTIKQDEPIRILMSGLPRIPDLGRHSISSSKTIFNFTCRALRQKVTHTCLPLTSWSEEDQYLNDIQDMQAVNEVLSDASDEAQKTYPNLQIKFSNVLFDTTIVNSDLAIDCFHPNAPSQSQIARQLWKEQPWFH